jgi:CheY-like chemotaxis protein
MTNKKVLLIDDDKDDQLFFLDAVQEIDEKVICDLADNGEKGIEQLTKNPPPPDIIFLDLNMPVMNGFECLTYLQKDAEFKKIPVVVFTTSSNPNDKERAQKLGAKLFVTKPPDFAAFKMILAAALQLAF